MTETLVLGSIATTAKTITQATACNTTVDVIGWGCAINAVAHSLTSAARDCCYGQETKVNTVFEINDCDKNLIYTFTMGGRHHPHSHSEVCANARLYVRPG